jgi:hypothetical protein
MGEKKKTIAWILRHKDSFVLWTCIGCEESTWKQYWDTVPIDIQARCGFEKYKRHLISEGYEAVQVELKLVEHHQHKEG